MLLPSENLSQNPSHNLAAPRLGQIGNHVNGLGRGKGTDTSSNLHDEFLAESIADLDTILYGYESIDGLACEFVCDADDGSFGNGVVLDEGGFDFGCGEAVAGDVDDVVYAASDPVEAFVVTTGSVTSELIFLVLVPWRAYADKWR